MSNRVLLEALEEKCAAKILKVLNKKTVKKFAFNCLLCCGSFFISLTVSLHVLPHESSSCVGGNAGSQLLLLVLRGMRLCGV